MSETPRQKDDDRWFILPMQSWPEESRRTVLAGKPIGANRLVKVFDTAEEAEAAVREHNAALDSTAETEAVSTSVMDRKPTYEQLKAALVAAGEHIALAYKIARERDDWAAAHHHATAHHAIYDVLEPESDMTVVAVMVHEGGRG